MIQQQYLMWLAGLILLVVAVLSWRDSANPRRFTTGLFWGLYGLIFLVGDWTTALMTQLMGSAESGTRTLQISVGLAVVIMGALPVVVG